MVKRELPVELAGEAGDKRDGHEDGAEHQRDGNDRAGYLAHRAQGGVVRREPVLDTALDVLDHDNGVIDHDADGEHQPEKRECVDGKSKGRCMTRERADNRHLARPAAG